MLQETNTPSATLISSTTSSSRRATSVVVFVVVLAGLAWLPQERRFECRDEDHCELRTRRVFGHSTIQIGPVSRLVSVETVQRKKRRNRSRSRDDFLELREPAQSIEVTRHIASALRTWMTVGTAEGGERQPPKATPFVVVDKESKIGLALMALLALAAGGLVVRQFVRIDLTRRGDQLTVRTRRPWGSKESVVSLSQVRLSSRSWDPRQARGGLWGVWAETVPGAGFWVAIGIAEIEAEHVVDLLQADSPFRR